jgi:hypothetical protein
MSIEDRVRTATRAGATLVRDIGPLPVPDPVRLRRRPAPTARRWRSWGIPLAAAAALVLVALSLVAVRQFSAKAPSAGKSVTASATVPRYYVALDESAVGYTGSAGLIVGDDLTGKTIATIKPPAGLQFDGVQGASDDRTFVVRASPKATQPSPVTWYLLRIAPGTTHPYRLAKLSISIPNGIEAALSPNDQELAIESFDYPSNSEIRTTLGIYSVSSGAELRSWTTGKFASGPAQTTLSWLSDGRRLAFSDVRSATGDRLSLQLRTLDVTGSGTDLMTASRTLLTVPLSGASTCYSLHLTPDGGTVVCAAQYAFLTGDGTSAGCANGGLEFTAYSARTGKPVGVLYRYLGACQNGISTLPWTDDSAAEIIGAIQTDVANEGGKQAGRVGVITDGHIRPLKLSKNVSVENYGTVAF